MRDSLCMVVFGAVVHSVYRGRAYVPQHLSRPKHKRDENEGDAIVLSMQSAIRTESRALVEPSHPHGSEQVSYRCYTGSGSRGWGVIFFLS